MASAARAAADLATAVIQLKEAVETSKDRVQRAQEQLKVAKDLLEWQRIVAATAGSSEAACVFRRDEEVQARRELTQAKAALEAARVALVKGPTKERMALILAEIESRVQGAATSEAWRLRAEAVEVFQKESARAARDYAFEKWGECCGSALHLAACDAARAAEDVAQRGATKERKLMQKALAREASS